MSTGSATTIRVIASAGAALPAIGQADVVRYAGAADAAAALQGQARAVLVSDALSADDLLLLAEAIRDGNVAVIEVHSTRWDGETHSPLTAACRGVIGGFGLDAIRYAIDALNAE